MESLETWIAPCPTKRAKFFLQAAVDIVLKDKSSVNSDVAIF